MPEACTCHHVVFYQGNLKFQKKTKNVTFSRFYRKLSVAQTLTLHYEIDNCLHPHAAFQLNFPGKIPISLLVMKECITSKKKPPKLYKGQHFFGFQLARGAPVCRAGGKPSTWFPPGSRRADHLIINSSSKFPSWGASQM